MIKKFGLLLAFAPLIAFGQQNKNSAPAKKPQTGVVLKSATDSASYAFGLKIATDLKSRGIESLNYDVWARAMQQVFTGQKTEMTAEQAQIAISTILSSRDQKKSEALMAEGKKFLAENKAKPGVITLPSGLQYIILTPGIGPKPKASDEVTVHYKGTLLNGFQFDSSIDRGEPISFNLAQVIPGWTEGVQQMQEGSKFRFFIPWDLAYGAKGAGQDIPPYSVLIFEIELLKASK